MQTDAGATVVAGRCSAQLLSRRDGGTPEGVVHHLLAVQAQDGRGMRLAVRSRSTGLSASDVDDALTVRRSLIVSWLNRGTLHLVAAEDYWWLHPLTTPQLATGNRRRLRQVGVSEVDEVRGVETIVERVTNEGPLTRAQLRDRLDQRGIPTAGQALVHLLVAATLGGHVVRGPMMGPGPDHAFVSVTDWLGAPPPALDRREALGRLTRRYLVGHSPAGPADLAKWAGISLGDARTGFGVLAGELVPNGADLWVLAGAAGPGDLPAPGLLGAFDPILLGWRSRQLITGSHTGLVTTNGIFRPFALVDGRVAGIWTLGAGVLSVVPLVRLSHRVRQQLGREGEDVARFLALSPVGMVIG